MPVAYYTVYSPVYFNLNQHFFKNNKMSFNSFFLDDLIESPLKKF